MSISTPSPPTNYCELADDLSQDCGRFIALVGTDDNASRADVVVRYNEIGDGNVIASETFGYGEVRKVVANVAGVLRLTIRISCVSGNWAYPTNHRWTEPRISVHMSLQPATPVV